MNSASNLFIEYVFLNLWKKYISLFMLLAEISVRWTSSAMDAQKIGVGLNAYLRSTRKWQASMNDYSCLLWEEEASIYFFFLGNEGWPLFDFLEGWGIERDLSLTKRERMKHWSVLWSRLCLLNFIPTCAWNVVAVRCSLPCI